MDIFNSFNELGLGSRLARLSEKFMKEIQLVYDEAFIDFDPHLFPVFQIIAHNSKVTNSFIYYKLNITQPAVTQAIKKLNDKGYLEISKDIKDRRKHTIELSSKGEELLTNLTPIWIAIDQVVKSITHFSSDSLLENIIRVEKELTNSTLHKTILQQYYLSTLNQTEIIPFDPSLSNYFKDLNVEWLKKYFVVEPYDLELMNNCKERIIDKGGYIFFSKTQNKISGTFSLIKRFSGTYELGKMAVKEDHQGLGIGQKLLEFCLDFAKKQDWNSLLLYSNTKLEGAIHIYKKFGFKEVPLEKNIPYLRSNIKMEYKIPKILKKKLFKQ